MNKKAVWQTIRFAVLALAAISVTGCNHHVRPDPLSCGYGTIETLIGGERNCVVAPLSCGDGTQEQATGGERECQPEVGADVLTCGAGTSELEQASGGERECVSGASECASDQVAYVTEDGDIACRPNIVCGDGSYEQATGGERECVPTGSVSGCGADTQMEQASGGERECVEVP